MLLRLPRPLPFLPTLLIVLLVLVQYPLWLGKGSWLRVWELDRLVTAQRIVNGRQEQRNTALEAEVRDLKQGLLAIEERARYELGMVRPDEVFVQINPPTAPLYKPPPPDAPPKQSSEPFRTAAVAPGLPGRSDAAAQATPTPSTKARTAP